MQDSILFLYAVQQGDWNVIYRLITSDIDLTHADQAGRQAIHFAAANGFTDIVSVLAEKDINVNTIDVTCQTPLHKAAQWGHSQTIMVLLAYGALIDPRDVECLTPLEVAVQAKQADAVEVLLLFGADPCCPSIDIDYLLSHAHRMSRKDKTILALLLKSLPLSPGLRSGGIMNETKVLLAGVTKDFPFVDVTALIDNQSSAILLGIRRTRLEYCYIDSILPKYHRQFSDRYEFRVYKSSEVHMNSLDVVLSITVEGTPRPHETIQLISLQGTEAKILKTLTDEANNQTVVDVFIVCKRKDNMFFLAIKDAKEKVKVSKEAMLIKPEGEPGAEIDLPSNVFDLPTELSIDIFDAYIDDEFLQSKPPITTNMLSLSTPNGQQPIKDIQITLPLTDSQTDEMCVLTTSHEGSNRVEDWEVLEAKLGNDMKSLVFNVQHFSFFVGAQRSQVKKDLKKLVDEISIAMKRLRKIEFSVYLRNVQNRQRVFELLIEGTIPRKTNSRRQHWHREGYIEQQYLTKSFDLPIHHQINIELQGNFYKLTKDAFARLEIDGKRKCMSVMFEIEIIDTESPAEGFVVIQQEDVFVEQVEKVIPASGFLCGKSKIIMEEIQHKMHTDLLEIPVKVNLEHENAIKFSEPEVSECLTEVKHDHNAYEARLQQMVEDIERQYPSTIEGYTTATLCNIAKNLTYEETTNLANNLLIGKEVVLHIRESSDSVAIAAFKILIRYRGKRPYISQINKLATTLKLIKREDLLPLLPDTSKL